MAVYSGNESGNILTGGSENDAISGFGGNDTLSGAGGDDNVNGGPGDDSLNGGTGNDSVIGGDGRDTLAGGGGDDTLTGGNGDDVIVVTGSGHTVWAYGDGGIDTLDLSGASGNQLKAAFQIERIVFNNFNNRWTGTEANETIEGAGGADVLGGSIGNDRLLGGEGDDWLDGGFGNDVLDGGAGFDLAFYDAARTGVQARLGANGVAIGSGLDGSGRDTLTGIEGLYGSEFADSLAGDEGDNVINGGAGDDSIFGGAGSDWSNFLYRRLSNGVFERLTTATVVDLRAGRAVGELGSDSLNGIENVLVGDGDDRIEGSPAANTLIGEGGADTLNGYAGDDSLFAGSGDDSVNSGEGADSVRGGAGNDRLLLLGGDDAAVGDAGLDLLFGGAGNDTLDGGEGEDRLSGEGGADVMTGGAGADRFLFGETDKGAFDRITDFNAADGDRIDLRGIDADPSAGGDQVFVKAAGFSGAPGEVTRRYDASAGSTRFEFNTDADLEPEFSLVLDGEHAWAGFLL